MGERHSAPGMRVSNYIKAIFTSIPMEVGVVAPLCAVIFGVLPWRRHVKQRPQQGDMDLCSFTLLRCLSPLFFFFFF